MGDTAEVVAKRYGVTRQAQDELSLASQQRIARAQREGWLKDELAPIQVRLASRERIFASLEVLDP